MRTAIAFLVLGALATAGCASRPKIDGGALIEVDSSFSPEDAQRVIDGVSLWNAASPDIHFRTATADHDWMLSHPASGEDVLQIIKVTQKSDPACTISETATAHHAAETYYEEGHTCLADEPGRVYGPGRLELLTAHEIGHMLGLDHTPAGVMAPSLDRDGITCADVARAGYRCAE